MTNFMDTKRIAILASLCLALLGCAKQGLTVRSTKGANCSVTQEGESLVVTVDLYPKKLGEYAEVRGIGRGVASPGSNTCAFVTSDPSWIAREYIESPKEVYSGDVVVVECGTVKIKEAK